MRYTSPADHRMIARHVDHCNGAHNILNTLCPFGWTVTATANENKPGRPRQIVLIRGRPGEMTVMEGRGMHLHAAVLNLAAKLAPDYKEDPQAPL